MKDQTIDHAGDHRTRYDDPDLLKTQEKHLSVGLEHIMLLANARVSLPQLHCSFRHRFVLYAGNKSDR